MKILAILAVMGAGTLLGIQPAVNAEVARRAGSPFAAGMLSLAISAAILLPLALSFGGLGGLRVLAGGPWWLFLGGIAGACFVMAGIHMTPVLGAVAFAACLVLGQALGTLAVDGFGLFGMPRRALNLQALAGLLLIGAGLALFLLARR